MQTIEEIRKFLKDLPYEPVLLSRGISFDTSPVFTAGYLAAIKRVQDELETTAPCSHPHRMSRVVNDCDRIIFREWRYCPDCGESLRQNERGR